MARKVIIDCDPGIDDAVALVAALASPELEILAITAVEGCVHADQASRNVQAIIEQLDPRRLPRLGFASPADEAPAVDTRYLHGDDGLGNSLFSVSQLHHRHASEKLIGDIIRAYPHQVTIIALGPLTNIARAFQREPQLPELTHRLIMMGGSVSGVGNISATSEFNVFFDPKSAREVFQSRVTKTLIPLDTTRQVTFGLDFLDQLPPISSRAGMLLRSLLPYSFRSYRQQLGCEDICLNDAVALIAATSPELFETEEMAGEVEVLGELTRGMTIFDRRMRREWSINMEVATSVHAREVKRELARRLQLGSE